MLVPEQLLALLHEARRRVDEGHAPWAALAAWGSDSLESDANGDGVIDGNDLATVLAGWGPCAP